MKSLLILGLALSFYDSVWAAKKFEINMEMALHGTDPRQVNIGVREGKKTIIEEKNGSKKNIIEVAAREKTSEGQKMIAMDFVIHEIDENGQKTIIAMPTILTPENETAEVSIMESPESNDSISLKVTPKSLH